MNLLSDVGLVSLSLWLASSQSSVAKKPEVSEEKEPAKKPDLKQKPSKYIFNSYIEPSSIDEDVRKTARILIFKGIDFTGAQLSEVGKQFPALRSIKLEGCRVNNKSAFKIRDVSKYFTTNICIQSSAS
jgi:hypothetical protein